MTAAPGPHAPPVRPERVTALCYLVSELERKGRRSITGRVLIEPWQVTLLAQIAEQLNPRVLEIARSDKPPGRS